MFSCTSNITHHTFGFFPAPQATLPCSSSWGQCTTLLAFSWPHKLLYLAAPAGDNAPHFWLFPSATSYSTLQLQLGTTHNTFGFFPAPQATLPCSSSWGQCTTLLAFSQPHKLLYLAAPAGDNAPHFWLFPGPTSYSTLQLQLGTTHHTFGFFPAPQATLPCSSSRGYQ